MKKTINMIRRVGLWFAIRSVEIHIAGMNEVLACVVDPLLEGRILINRSIACRELARLRSEYVATLPPGRRIVWGSA